MNIFKSILPNVTISLNIVMLILIYLDMRNPMMGFLMETPFWLFAAVCAICSIATAVFHYAAIRSQKEKDK